MKKLLNIFVAVLTGLIGVFGYYVFFFFLPAAVPEVKEIIPLHRVEKNPQRYLSNKVILQEDLVVFRDKYNNSLSYYIQGHKEKCEFIPRFCSGVEELVCTLSASLDFKSLVKENEVKMIEEIAMRNSQRSENNPNGGMYGAKVEITGYVRTLDDFENYFLFKNYFTIDVINIKQISPIRFISEEEMSKPK